MTRTHGTQAPPRPPTWHPDLEQVAAFVEGRMEGEERQRMVIHLASCDDCHELVAETTELLRPDPPESAEREPGQRGDSGFAHPPHREARAVLRPHPGRWKHTLPLIAAVAAAAVLAVLAWGPALDVLQGRPGEPVPAAALAQGLELGAEQRRALSDVDEHGWRTFLGEAGIGATEQLSFQLGVRNAELAAALAALMNEEAGDGMDRAEDLRDGEASPPSLPERGHEASGESAGSASSARPCPLSPGPRFDACVRTSRLLGLLRASTPASLATPTFTRLWRALLDGEPAASLQHTQGEAEALLRSTAGEVGRSDRLLDRRYLDLGHWAGIADLARKTGDLEWFRSQPQRRLLHRLAEEDFPPPVREPLDRLERHVEAGLAAEGRPVLAADLAELIAVAGGGEAATP